MMRTLTELKYVSRCSIPLQTLDAHTCGQMRHVYPGLVCLHVTLHSHCRQVPSQLGTLPAAGESLLQLGMCSQKQAMCHFQQEMHLSPVKLQARETDHIGKSPTLYAIVLRYTPVSPLLHHILSRSLCPC